MDVFPALTEVTATVLFSTKTVQNNASKCANSLYGDGTLWRTCLRAVACVGADNMFNIHLLKVPGNLDSSLNI